MRLRYDLHLHSCLSPCGDEEMTPYNLVGLAKLWELDLIALTDHNTAGNCGAAMEAGREAGLTVVPGMELTTAEEIHLVCLFPGLAEAKAFSDHVRGAMPPFPNEPKAFGHQIYMDGGDRRLGEEGLLLLNASLIGVDEAPGLVASCGGVCYPAHIDRPANSIIAVFGSIEADMGFRCAEVSRRGDPAALTERYPALGDMRILRSSDAHCLEDMGEALDTLELSENSPRALIDYLRNLS